MTDKEYAEKIWREEVWWCIKCDSSIETEEEAYLHPDYCEAIVCEDCYRHITRMRDPNW